MSHGCAASEPAPLPDKHDPAAAAIISSAYLNAVGIALSLREIGWRGRVICLCVNGAPDLASRWPSVCERWRLDLATPADLLPHLVGRLRPSEPHAFFFTDERFLPLFASGQPGQLFPRLRFHAGSARFVETILDRRCFYRFVAQGNLAPVPHTVPSSADPWQEFGGAFWIRLWRTWNGVRNQGHGRAVRSRHDLERWHEHCRHKGLQPEDWGYQELLSTVPQDNVSVCGWHEPGQRFYRTLRRLFPYRECAGPVFEVIPDPASLGSQTQVILEGLDYAGPFEMEFVLDPRTGQFKVNELNPRFWAQHRLLARLGDNWLVRRYLGEQPREPATERYRFWLNTDDFLTLLFSGKLAQTVPYLRRACWSHPIRGSLTVAARNAWTGLW